jgi:diguanylate cyclase (GGDEF)-like protein/PAS domain S-box-containing protein
MAQGVVMFDASERLVVCNDRYKEMYGLSSELVKPGCTLHDIVRYRIANGSLDHKAADYIGELTAAMAQGKTATWIVECGGDGRAISVTNRPFAGGCWVATHEDITERRRAERELERTKSFLNTIIENVPAMIMVKDAREQRYVLINRTAKEFLGSAREGLIGKNAYDVFPKDQADFITKRDNDMLRSGQHMFVDDEPVQSPGDAEARIVTSKRVAIRDDQGEAQYLLTVLEDITERKRADDHLRQTREFLNTVIENVPSTIVVKDTHDFRYVLVNRAGERYFGIPRDQMVGRTAWEIFPQPAADLIIASDRQLIDSGQGQFADQQAVETPGNGTRIVATRRLPILGDDGKPQYLLDVIDDVTERKRAEEQIAHMAHHDALTDLPNRAAFTDCLDATLEKAAKGNESFAVMCVDLDRFKEVNDVFGHSVGDALLREAACRLQEAAGGAFLARIGGDEFTLIAVDGPSKVEAIGQRLLASVVGDLEIEGHRLRCGLSIGVAIYPTDGVDATALLGNADAALYRAKSDGRGTIRFFEPEMDRRLRERRALQQELQSVLDNRELTLLYQPQALIDGKIIGFEALIRWQHPSRGLIPPEVFVPLAEESGLIIPMGEWVLREACREAASWPKPLHVAVNLSPVQFRHGDLPGLVHSVLWETGLSPGRLELEITEGLLIDDYSRAVSILNRLKALGVRIAMDDFGTGYSSLSYLQALPLDKVKIDRAFIANLSRNTQSVAIVRAVIGLGRGLGLPVVAEGVETQEQLAFLSREACDEVQGYLVGPPARISLYDEFVGRPKARGIPLALAG